ncbi:MAG: hypothetical protein ABI760_17225 [Ferruginibacter sp.]
MAFQRSIFKLFGKLGDKVFYRRKGKYLARGESKKKYKRSEGSKQSSKEFGSASTAGRLLRKGFAKYVKRFADNEFIDRLTSKFIRIVNSGPIALKGSRHVTDGDVALLKGMEMNSYTSLDNLLKFKPKTRIEAPDKIYIELPEFMIQNAFNAPLKGMVVVLEFMCCVFDFPGKWGEKIWLEDIVLPLKDGRCPNATLELPMDGAEGKVLVICMGIYFRDSDNRQILNRKSKAAKLLDAVYLREGKIVQFQYPEPPKVIDEDDEPVKRIPWKFGT